MTKIEEVEGTGIVGIKGFLLKILAHEENIQILGRNYEYLTPLTEEELREMAEEFGDVSKQETWQELLEYFTSDDDE